jgi:hypothetical protein
MKTKHEIKTRWRDHGVITIPAGVRVKEIPGEAGMYWVDDLTWLPKNSIQLHDATYYGIRLKEEDVE